MNEDVDFKNDKKGEFLNNVTPINTKVNESVPEQRAGDNATDNLPKNVSESEQSTGDNATDNLSKNESISEQKLNKKTSKKDVNISKNKSNYTLSDDDIDLISSNIGKLSFIQESLQNLDKKGLEKEIRFLKEIEETYNKMYNIKLSSKEKKMAKIFLK